MQTKNLSSPNPEEKRLFNKHMLLQNPGVGKLGRMDTKAVLVFKLSTVCFSLTPSPKL